MHSQPISDEGHSLKSFTASKLKAQNFTVNLLKLNDCLLFVLYQSPHLRKLLHCYVVNMDTVPGNRSSASVNAPQIPMRTLQTSSSSAPPPASQASLQPAQNSSSPSAPQPQVRRRKKKPKPLPTSAAPAQQNGTIVFSGIGMWNALVALFAFVATVLFGVWTWIQTGVANQIARAAGALGVAQYCEQYRDTEVCFRASNFEVNKN